MRICAIHQPNFFPWLGYFDKIRRADVFVFLDDVALSKSGSRCWTNRVRVNIQGAPAWFGCPLRREHGEQKICSVQMDPSGRWRRKLVRTLEMNYRRARHFDAVMANVEPLIVQPTDNLAEFNINAVRALTNVLGLKCEFVRQSSLPGHESGTELLIRLTRAVGATAYLCGGGAQGYQRDELFVDHGLNLIYQDFEPKPYGDVDKFIPGLSVIDWLMHVGPGRHDWESVALDVARLS
jgi:hypothetical protein